MMRPRVRPNLTTFVPRSPIRRPGQGKSAQSAAGLAAMTAKIDDLHPMSAI
jgi:hypothetical protein